MQAAMERAVREVRQAHLDALRGLGVSAWAIAHLGQHQPPFGVMTGTIDRSGLFLPGDGPARVVQPVIIGRQIIDIVAWRTARPDSWNLTTGLGWLMGEDQIYTAPGEPVHLHSTPLQWLASCRRETMAGQGSRPMTTKAQFLTLYRQARQGDLAGDSLYRAALALTGEPSGPFQGPIAARLYNAVTMARAEPEPMRQKLQRDVLNCWGHGNPYRSPPMESPRFAGWQRTTRQADTLRKRLASGGRLELDAGNWVVRVLSVNPHPIAA